MRIITRLLCAALCAFAVTANSHAAKSPIPELRTVHGAVQLFVDGKPFLVRGGELNN